MPRRLNNELKRQSTMTEPPTVDDKTLVQATRDGDRAAFSKLVLKYQDKVFYLAYDLIGEYDDAKDVAQEAFIRAFEKIHQFEDRAQFSTWLYRITVNLAMDQHRRRKRRPLESLDDHIQEIERQKSSEQMEESLKTDDLLQTGVQRFHIDEALKRLSDHQRISVVMKYFHQKSSREIGELLGCSENTVRIHLFRGLRNLKRHLDKVKKLL
jgi:RNA polymerase sigma-70 factor, ECF subfamily